MLNGKVALVTGASSGIGKAVAIALADEGCRVGLIARREQELKALAADIKDRGGEALALPADVTDSKQVQKAVADATAAWKAIDIAIANAGVGRLHRIANLNTEKIRSTMNLNFYGAWHLFEAVLPGMLAAGSGHLVGISSFASFRGMPKSGPYSASKAALSLFMESARIELKSKGIYCTLIHPGFVRTPLAEQNTFKMPLMLEADDAAKRIVRCIKKHKSEAIIPWQLALITPLYRIIPNRIFDRLTAGV